ncbi:MAG: insulinase family protein [Clostridia bacterium]
MKIYSSELLKDKVIYTKLSCGLKVYISDLKCVSTNYMLIGTNFGSMDIQYIDAFTGKKVILPIGTQHFLEHKVFSDEGVTLDEITKLGLSSNAYTTKNTTVYFIEGLNNFTLGAEHLIKKVLSPVFTDENIKSERCIIEREIDGFNARNTSRLKGSVNEQLYASSTFKYPVLGTSESISKITKECLYGAYNNFYSLDNMFLIYIGSVSSYEDEISKIDSLVNRYLNKEVVREKNRSVEYFVASSSVEQKEILDVLESTDISKLCISFKLERAFSSNLYIKRSVALNMLQSIYFGLCTDFFTYMSECFASAVSLSYEASKAYEHVQIYMECRDILQAKAEILKNVRYMKKNAVSKEEFTRAKRKAVAGYIRSFSSPSTLANIIMQAQMLDISPYYVLEVLDTLSIEDLEKYKEILFNENMMYINIEEKS